MHIEISDGDKKEFGPHKDVMRVGRKEFRERKTQKQKRRRHIIEKEFEWRQSDNGRQQMLCEKKNSR